MINRMPDDKIWLGTRRGGFGKSLITNRALLGIIAAALLLLLAMLGMQGMSAYVFPNVYRSTQAQSVVALLSNVAIIAICAPLASKLASKFGKKSWLQFPVSLVQQVMWFV